MEQTRNEIVAWVAGQILPHEREVRGWLRRSGASDADIDDLVQEAYCRLAALSSVAHIGNGRAYFFQTVRNIAVERMRRARVVRIDHVTEIDALNVIDGEPSPERVAAGRSELRRVSDAIEELPERCRTIFKLRRIYGLPQREIARRLGVTENVVEMQTARGLRLLMARLLKEDVDETKAAPADEPAAKRKRDR